VREFESVLAFAEHLVVLKHELHKHTEHGLEKALQIIQTDAEQQIGHYQEAAGRFPEWAPLADSTEAEKARLGYPADAPLLREGDLQHSFSHEVEGNEGIVGSTDPTMVYHEFGTSKMPPRPVMGPAVFNNRNKVEKIIGRALVEAIVDGEVVSELGADYFGDG
jgi:HK97 gp10 family phage protein